MIPGSTLIYFTLKSFPDSEFLDPLREGPTMSVRQSVSCHDSYSTGLFGSVLWILIFLDLKFRISVSAFLLNYPSTPLMNTSMQ